MKNANATILLATNIKTAKNGIRTLEGIFNGIIPNRDVNGFFLDDIYIALSMTILYNYDESHNIIGNNVGIDLDRKYQCMILFAHRASGACATIDSFPLYITKEDLKHWCKGIYELKRYVKVPSLRLPKGLGEYSVKLLIREETTDTKLPWTTQTISTLEVGGVNPLPMECE